MAVNVQTRFITTLNGNITDTADNCLLDAAPANSTGYVTFERGDAQEEDSYYGGLAGLQLTSMLRGLSKTALTNTEVSGNKKTHADNVTVEGTLLHYIINDKADVDGDETYTGTNTFSGVTVFADDKARSTTNAAPVDEDSFTNKKYVNDQDALKGNLSGGNTWAGTQIFANDSARSTTNAAPVDEKSFANKKYIDDQLSAAVPVATYTAVEDIAIGKPVVKTSVADQIENLAIASFATAGTEATFEAGATSLIKAVYAARGKVAVIYADGGDSKGYVVCGTIPATSTTITWGTPQEICATALTASGIAYIDDNRIAFVYTYGGANYLRVGTLSGTVFTLGSESAIGGGAATYNAAISPTTDTVVVAYDDAGDSSIGKMKAAIVTGTAIGSFGSASQFEAGNTNHISLAKLDTDKVLVSYSDGGDSDKGKAVVATVSGTSISSGSPVDFETAVASDISSEQITTDRVLIAWIDTTNTEVNAIVASVSGLTLTFPTAEIDVSGSAGATASVTVLSATEAVVAFEDTTSSDGKFNKITISGTTLTAGTERSFNSTNNVSSVAVAKVSDANKIMVLYRDEAASNVGNAVCFQEIDNSRKIIGFAREAIAAGASSIIVKIGPVGNQTGLTVGQEYFIGSTGALSTTDDLGIRVGVARDTDELDVDIDITPEDVVEYFPSLIDSSLINLHKHSNNDRLLETDLNTLTITNSGAETTIYDTTVTGGTLGTGNAIRFQIYISSINDAGVAGNSDFKLKYGATTVVTLTFDTGNTSGSMLEGYLFANASTSVQAGFLRFDNINIAAHGVGTAAEDSTVDKTLAVTVTGSGGGFDLTAQFGTFTILAK